MNNKKLLNELYKRNASEVKLGLKNIKSLLKKIGNPEKNLKCILVGGTNGKGSVSTMIYSVLKDNGFKVGLYTSPHYKNFNERIVVDGKNILEKEVAKYYGKIESKIEDQSFFEITTAMAYLYFKDKKVDFAILEVGLGGRLDATNVIKPIVSVITNVGLDHSEILGGTVEEITFEKCGIIKNKIPIVTGAKGDALKLISEIAKKRKSPLKISKKKINFGFKFIHGYFQQYNGNIAFEVLKLLEKECKIKDIEKGIENVKIKGRFELIEPNVLVDPAHNFEGIKELVKELKNKKVTVVFGVLKDKNVKKMLNQLLKISSRIILTKPNNERAMEPEDILNLVPQKKIKNFKIIKKPSDALKYAKKESKKLIVVCGSFYLVGEILK